MSVRINLLPEARLTKLRNAKTKRLVTLVCTVVGASFVIINIVLVLLLGTRTLISTRNADQMSKLKSDLQSKESLIKDVSQFNTSLANAAQLDQNRIYLSEIFKVTSQSIPKESRLTDVSVDSAYGVKASVKAKDYETVSRFIVALENFNVTYGEVKGMEKKPVFLNIEIESVTKKLNEDAVFDVTFDVDKELVKKLREQAKTTATDAGGAQ